MNDLEYANYLKGRSWLGLIYRYLYLYPRLNRYFIGRLLDVGCGVGDLLAYVKHANGVDVNPFNVDFCVHRGLNAKKMEFDKIPMTNASCDTVVLDNVLEHISNPFPILADIRRVLDADGRLVVGVPGVKGYESDPDHKVFYDEDLLEKVAKESGFAIVEYVYTPLFKGSLFSRKINQYCIYSIWRPIA
jgi:SAM-dependent methyltransferase